MARKLTTDEIVLALLSNTTQKAAAEKLGITVQTLCNKVKSKSIQRKLQEVRKMQVQTVSNQLVASSSTAMENLIEMLNSENEYSRYNASLKILSLAEKYIKMEDILTRLDELETRLKE